MSRNPELEAVLQALFDLETCARDERHIFRRRYEQLLDQAIAKGTMPGILRSQAEELLREPYREFRRAKRLQERARLSRLQ